MEQLAQLARIGSSSSGGVLRAGLGRDEQHACELVASWMAEAGMLFVRSRNGGVSHRPDELTDEADIATAAAVLTRTQRALCGSPA